MATTRTDAPAEPRAPSSDHPLRQAFRAAIAFPVAGVAAMPDRAHVEKLAEEEAQFGTVGLTERGLSSGMALGLLEPVGRTLRAWREARAPFDHELEPFRPDLEALARHAADLARQAAARDTALADVARRSNERSSYVATRQRYHESKIRFEEARGREGNRDARTWGGSITYWVALLAIFAAEWLINYDTVLQFFGVRAIAFGTTAVLALLIAFAAHEHGQIWKQWSYRFAQHRTSAERWSDRRNFALATLALYLVLGAAGWMRYIYASKALGLVSPSGNLLGAEAGIDIDPIRDVLVSLLANIGAWLVGVFIALFAHDRDPDLVDATTQWERWRRRFERADRRYVDERATTQAKYERERKQTETEATTRRQRVGPQEDMRRQVYAHEGAVVASLASQLRAAAELYRDGLVRIAATRNLAFVRAPQQTSMTGFEVRTMPIQIDEEFVRAQG